jgi:hypothetical protein
MVLGQDEMVLPVQNKGNNDTNNAKGFWSRNLPDRSASQDQFLSPVVKKKQFTKARGIHAMGTGLQEERYIIVCRRRTLTACTTVGTLAVGAHAFVCMWWSTILP